jgi:hypothetical protein
MSLVAQLHAETVNCVDVTDASRDKPNERLVPVACLQFDCVAAIAACGGDATTGT